MLGGAATGAAGFSSTIEGTGWAAAGFAWPGAFTALGFTIRTDALPAGVVPEAEGVGTEATFFGWEVRAPPGDVAPATAFEAVFTVAAVEAPVPVEGLAPDVAAVAPATAFGSTAGLSGTDGRRCARISAARMRT